MRNKPKSRLRRSRDRWWPTLRRRECAERAADRVSENILTYHINGARQVEAERIESEEKSRNSAYASIILSSVPLLTARFA